MSAFISTLQDRLRGIYRYDVTKDGMGQLDGSDTFERTFETPPIQKEAADYIDHLESMLKRANKFTFDRHLAVERRSLDEDVWAVTDGGGSVYNTDGVFEYEPLPSSRDEEFYARTRFTLKKAMEIAENLFPMTLKMRYDGSKD